MGTTSVNYYSAPSNDLLPKKMIQDSINDRLSNIDSINSLQYGPTLGDLEMRDELSLFLTTHYKDKVDPSHLAVTNGATQSFSK
jgi:DNA-binding transcriptional MocR family regulator